jgi:hypothetical protein
MKLNRYFILGIIAVSLILLGYGLSVSQENASKEQPPLIAEPQVQWLWGEVVSVDPQINSVLVKYLDYESDTEKEMLITTDAKTVYDNAKALADIKIEDALSIDYIVTGDGKNLAKNISVEKPEVTETLPPEEAMPAAPGNASAPQPAE